MKIVVVNLHGELLEQLFHHTVCCVYCVLYLSCLLQNKMTVIYVTHFSNGRRQRGDLFCQPSDDSSALPSKQSE